MENLEYIIESYIDNARGHSDTFDCLTRLKALKDELADKPEIIGFLNGKIGRLEQDLEEDGYCPNCGEELETRGNYDEYELPHLSCPCCGWSE